jgi:hypothetical protein
LAKQENPKPSLKEAIVDIVQREKPETIKQLAKLANKQLALTENQTVELVIQLENEGKMRLLNKEPRLSTLSAYLLSPKTYWFWITIFMTITTTIASLTIPENLYPLIYIRQIVGVISLLVLPGYTLLKVLFPTHVPIKTTSENLDTVERIALSIGISIALIPMMGLLLNYTPWGINLVPVVLSLLALTSVLAIAALLREFHIQSL